MTLSDLQSHSPVASLFKWNFTQACICAAFDNISTDIGLARREPLVLLLYFRVFSCIFFCNFLYFSLRYGFKCKCNQIFSPGYLLCAHWDDKPVQSFYSLPPPRSLEEVMFSSLSVCLSVRNFAQKLPNGFAWNFHRRLANEQVIKFWWRYGSGSGYGSGSLIRHW